MIITINGMPGSGKTTVAKKLAAKLGYRHYYMGGLRRKIARQRGMTLAELNKLGEKKFFTDKIVDDYQKRLGKTEDNFVIEGRTSFFLIPHSLKIFLGCSLTEGAKRIWGALKKSPKKRNEDKNLNSYQDVLKSIKERMRSDRYRYRKYYKMNIFAKKHYDLFLDTSALNQKQEFGKVYEFVKNYKASRSTYVKR